jgi:hypothetical protein
VKCEIGRARQLAVEHGNFADTYQNNEEAERMNRGCVSHPRASTSLLFGVRANVVFASAPYPRLQSIMQPKAHSGQEMPVSIEGADENSGISPSTRVG